MKVPQSDGYRTIQNRDERCMSPDACIAKSKAGVCRSCSAFNRAMTHACRMAGYLGMRLKVRKTDTQILVVYLNRSPSASGAEDAK